MKSQLVFVLTENNQQKQFHSIPGSSQEEEKISEFWPQIREDYPVNLRILISGGKETNKDSASNSEWSGNSPSLKSPLLATANCSLKKCLQTGCTVLKLLGTTHHSGWQSRIRHIVHQPRGALYESGCLETHLKMGGKLLLKLNIGMRPIANKNHEGNMKSTLKRKLIVRETAVGTES